MINTTQRIIFCTMMMARLIAADVSENEQPWEKRQRERREAKARELVAAETQSRDEKRAIEEKEFEAQWHVSYDVPLDQEITVVELDEVPEVNRGSYHMLMRGTSGDVLGRELLYVGKNMAHEGFEPVVIRKMRKLLSESGRLIATQFEMSDTRSIYVRVIENRVWALTDRGHTAAVAIAQKDPP